MYAAQIRMVYDEARHLQMRAPHHHHGSAPAYFRSRREDRGDAHGIADRSVIKDRFGFCVRDDAVGPALGAVSGFPPDVRDPALS
jgi:hypothetical protein